MILKKRLSRIITFIISCVLVGAAVFQSLYIVNRGYSREKKYYASVDGMESADYSGDLRSLYDRLYALSNIYLRYTDKNGKFTCSKPMERSVRKALSDLELMDEKGKIIIDNPRDFEYYASFGENVLTNTGKSAKELAGEYSAELTDGKGKSDPVSPDGWHNGNTGWYTTNYGMTYFYLGYSFQEGLTYPRRAVAVFDFDTDGLDYYTDENGARIYYKLDGTTPLPERKYMENAEYSDREAFEQFEHDRSKNYFIAGDRNDEQKGFDNDAETVFVDDISQYTDTDLYMIYDENSRTWTKIKKSAFTKTQGDSREISIYIKPSDALVTEYEALCAEREKQEKESVNSITYLIPLGIAGIIVGIVLLFCCGYSAKQKKFVLSLPDRLYGELILGLLIGAIVSVCVFIGEGIFRNYNDLSEYYTTGTLSILEGSVIIGLYALGLACLITLVTRLKCRSFWKTTLTGSIVSFLWKKFKKTAAYIREKHRQRSIRHIERNAMKEDIFMRRFIRRTVIAVAAEFMICIITIPGDSWGGFVFLSLAALAAYIFFSMRDHAEIAGVSQQIAEMSGGDYAPRTVPEMSPAYGMTNNLNNISDGIRSAVDRQVQSERMKVELVTNVSHDLKTPLTSIISYIDLLWAEDMSPAAKDYVKVISEKSERLKLMVADLFDLAKAASRTELNNENLDAVILTKQVIGDMADRIESSGRELRTDIQAQTAPVMAEGKKLYRVFQNLIDNALKYSMEGTRIYVTLRNSGGYTDISVKNISAEEMNFTPEEITERFTRGDKARSTEGNGLGLAIAKSFTEACGGTFEIIIDGDMFTANVRLPITVQKTV